MAVEKTEYDLSIKGQDTVAAGWDKVAQAAKQSGTATADAGAKLDQVGTTAAASAPKIQQFGSVVGLAARGVGEINPHLGQMVSVLGSATGAIGAMEAALGPLGLAIGIATTAFTLIEQAVEAFDDQQARTAGHIRDQIIPALDDLISKSRQAQAQLTLRARLSSGRGSEEEQAGFTQEAEEYVRVQRDRMNIARAQGDELEASRHEAELHRAEEVVRYREGLEDQARQRGQAADILAAQQTEQARARAALQAQIEEAEGSGRIGRNAGSGGRGRGGRDGFDSLIGQLAGNGFQESGLGEDQFDPATQRVEAEKDAEARLAKWRDDERKRREAADKAAHDKRIAAIAAEMQMQQQLGDVVKSGLTTVGEIAASTAKNEAEGIKVKAGFQGAVEVVDAIVEQAKAISDFASFNYVGGAGHEAAAIAHGVAAGKYFAIAGGGGGGGGAPGGAAAGGGAPRPPDAQAGRGAGGMTINILGPMIAAGDKSAVGRILSDSIRAGQSRFGTHPRGLAA